MHATLPAPPAPPAPPAQETLRPNRAAAATKAPGAADAAATAFGRACAANEIAARRANVCDTIEHGTAYRDALRSAALATGDLRLLAALA